MTWFGYALLGVNVTAVFTCALASLDDTEVRPVFHGVFQEGTVKLFIYSVLTWAAFAVGRWLVFA